MTGELPGAVCAFVLTWALHALLLLVALVVVLRALRCGDAVRDLAWRAALVVPLCTTALQLAGGLGVRSGAWALDLAGPPAVDARAATEAVARPRAAPTSRTLGPGSAVPAPPRRAGRAAVAVVPPPATTTGAAAGPASRGPNESPAPEPARRGWLPVVFGVVAVLGLTRLGVQRVRLQALLRRRRPLIDTGIHAAARRLAHRAGLRATPRLTVSDVLTSPVALGVLRAEICLPHRAVRELDAAAREALLAHEIAHHLRRDPLWLEFAHALCALAPWHPLPHVARARLAATAEFRCDALAAELVGAVPLAECLVEVAGWSCEGDRRGRPPLGVVAGMAVGGRGLEARVDRVLQAADQARRAPRRGPVAAALLAVTCGAAAVLPAVEPAHRAPRPAPATAGAAAATPARSASSAPPREVAAATSTRAGGSDLQARLAAELPVLLEVVDVEHELLVLEVEALRAELEVYDARTPHMHARLAGLESRLTALDRRRAALARAVDDYLGDAAETAAPGAR